MKVAIIGSGNVSYHLARAFDNPVVDLSRIIVRDKIKAETYFDKDKLATTKNLKNLKSDVVIIAVPDDAIEQVLEEYSFSSSTVLAHTSGSVSIDVFRNRSFSNFGCLYPLQTLSLSRAIEYSSIPIYIEGSNNNSFELLNNAAKSFSTKVCHLDSAARLKVHLAAVVASNFSNHMFHIANRIMENENLGLDQLSALMREVVDKAIALGPKEAQTGPAMRGDINTLKKHLDILEDEKTKLIYKLISQQIQTFQRHFNK